MTRMVMRHPYSGQPVASPDVAATAISAMRRPAELWLLGSLLAIYLLILALETDIIYRFLNVAGPMTLTAVLGWSCYRMVIQSSIVIWAPMFWFRLASAVYYGFGALVPHVVNEETRSSILSFYYFNEATNLKVNTIYCFGIFLVIFLSFIFMRNSCKYTLYRKISNNNVYCLLLSFLFIIIGGGVRYIIVIPHTFGLTSSVLPGMFGPIYNLFYVGIYLLLVFSLKFNKRILPLAFILIGVEVFVSILSFAKIELLLIIIFSFLGFISHKMSKTKIIIGMSCVLLAFFSFQPLVNYGREQIYQRYNSIAGAGLYERWAIVQAYFDGGNDAVKSTQQGGLSRLSYMNVDAFVVDRYDVGYSGDTLRNAAAVLIPRILWPGKPIITDLGSDLYWLISGRTGSSLGVGHFAEAYWNFGWIGIIPFMAVLSLILSIYTQISMKIMAHQDWLLLPIVFIGVNIGLRVDGHFVPDVLGPAWMAICLGLSLIVARSMARTLLGRRTIRMQSSAWNNRA